VITCTSIKHVHTKLVLFTNVLHDACALVQVLHCTGVDCMDLQKRRPLLQVLAIASLALTVTVRHVSLVTRVLFLHAPPHHIDHSSKCLLD
jgi:hypothetical protein